MARSFIVHFAAAIPEEVARTVDLLGRGDPPLVLVHPYSPEEYAAEYEDDERLALRAALGGDPTASLQIQLRSAYGLASLAHGVALARGLLRAHPGVADDDHGRPWTLDAIEAGGFGG